MKIDGDIVTFESTENEFYAHNGVIGLSEPKDGKWKVFEGYDGRFSERSSGGMTKEEKIELAVYMIDLWSRFIKDV